MKKIIALVLLTLSLGVSASEEVDLDSASIDLTDKQSLQRGAQHFVTYCLGCHSAKQIRYKRIALDLDVPENVMLADIAPLGASIYDQLHTAMNKHDAEKWFGTQPPDLSLIARVRGADWLYTYLKSFYTDSSRPFGVNNKVFPDVAMPNVLWQLQGQQALVPHKTIYGESTKLLIEEAGVLTEAEFETFVNDLVNFLVYVGEPTQLERESLGKYVLFFLLIFSIIAYLLKKEYWKDVD